MDPGSSGVRVGTPKNNGKGILERPSLLCRTAAKNFHKIPLVSAAHGVSLNGPITPATNRELEAYDSLIITSPEPDLANSQLDDGYCSESSTDACTTPKESIFRPFPTVSDGCETPRASVFDPFAPCQTCPPTPGRVIPHRIRLW